MTPSSGTWVEVDLGAVRENVRAVLSILPPETSLAAVVKANAYGHGAVATAQAMLQAGASRLAVTTVAEAAELREGGVHGPVLLLAPHLADEDELVVRHRLTPTLVSLSAAQRLATAAYARGVTVPCHLEVDTGMGRSGVPFDQAAALAAQMWPLEGIRLEGIWQHFATAFRGRDAFVARQFERFQEVLAACERAGVQPPIRHAANSAALLAMPETCLDMARVGTLLYGQYPSSRVPRRLSLRDTWYLKTRIVDIRRLRPGQTVGYGREWRASRDSVIATIRLGFADGLGVEPTQLLQRENRLLPGARRVLRRALGRGGHRLPSVRGVRAPIVGRISMSQCSLDVTDVPGVSVGDEVVLSARRVTTSPRIPRVYVGTAPEASRVAP